MIRPVQQDAAFLEDVQNAPTDAFSLWWLGQSGFLVKWAGSYLLLDPYLSDSLTHKYAATDKPHVRMTERVVDPAQLGFVNVVTSSHNHTDHLDADTLKPLLADNPDLVLVAPAANREFVAQRLEVTSDRITAVDAGQTVDTGPFKLHAIPSAHEALDRDEAGQYPYLGYVVEAGPVTLYHSGDTVRYPDVVEWLRPFSLDLALLPINGANPERRVAGNLDGREAAQLAHDAGAKLVIPCHYELFEFNTASPDDFVAACQALGQAYHVLRAGERWSPPPAPRFPE